MADRSSAYSKSRRYFSMLPPCRAGEFLANVGNLLHAQAVGVYLRASRAPSPIDHVARVVGMSAKQKMGSVHAGAIIAFMADDQPFGNGASGYLPRMPMRASSATSPLNHSANYAIAPDSLASGPFDTAVGDFHRLVI